MHKAVRSPLFNARPEVMLLLDFIEKTAAKIPEKRLQSAQKLTVLGKETAYRFVFKDQSAFDDGKIRHLMTYLLEVLRACLAWNDWQKDPANINLHLCRSLKKLGLETFFEKEIARSKSDLEKSGHQDDTYYFRQFSLENESWEMLRLRQRSVSGYMQTISSSFGNYVAINTLRQACTVFMQQTLKDVSISIPYLEATLQLAETGIFNDVPAVNVWFCSYMALTSPQQEAYFTRLKKHIVEDAAAFPDSDLRDFYILAINVCIRRINAADKKFIREAFDLYRSGLELGVFLENGYLSKFTYRNVMNIAVALGEWAWAYAYLAEFQSFLPPRDQENIFRYNLATYYFRKNDYEKALELLRHVEMSDMLENFDVRRMLLRIYFERGEWQVLDSLLDSFGTYLRRHKEGGYHRDMYRNLVFFLKKMSLNPLRTDKEQEKLAVQVKETQFLAEREWLLSVL